MRHTYCPGNHVKPVGDRLLIQPLEEKEGKKGGIIIPDTA
jgi:co-chaperonin GroES (HSP10)